MVYFQAVGGLANRMRSIDSAIEWCKKYKKNLTVLWLLNHELNCPFEELFLKPLVENIEINIIDCPVGFPNRYMFDAKNLLKTKESKLKRKVIDVVKGRKGLLEEHKKIIENLKKISNNQILENSIDFHSIYYKINKNHAGTSRELDAIFLEKSNPILKNFFSSKDEPLFISSCYRLHKLVNNYQNFVPVDSLINKALNKAELLNNTYGLHVRRSDHNISKSVSSDEKFISLIYNKLKINSNANFFISTDDDLTKQKLINEFGAIIIFNDITSFDRNSKEAIKDAILDLYCLSMTKAIYGSHQSSFSQVAADIGRIKETTVK